MRHPTTEYYNLNACWRLARTVLGETIYAIVGVNQQEANEAVSFVVSPQFELWIQVLGLEVDVARNIILDMQDAPSRKYVLRLLNGHGGES